MWTSILNGLGWCLLKLCQLVDNYGLAIILFTILSKVVLLPFAMKSKKGMLKMTAFTPKMKALEEKYKNDKDRYNIEVQKLYKEEKVNPMGGCLWTLLPFPILIALYGVLRLPLTHMFYLSAGEVSTLSSFLSGIGAAFDPATVAANQLPLVDAINANFDTVQRFLPDIAAKLSNINLDFFGISLATVPNWQYLNVYWFLPILSAAASWFSSFILQRMQGVQQQQQQQGSMKFMVWMGPVISLMIGYSWPSAMSIYWIANSLISTLQEALLTLYYRKKLNLKSPKQLREEEEAAKAEAKRRAEERAERLERLRTEGPQQQNRSNMSSKKYRQLKAQQQRKTEKPALRGPELTDDKPDDEEEKESTEND